MNKTILKKLFLPVIAAMTLTLSLPAPVMAAVPAQPTGLYAVAASGSVILNWTDASTDETSWKVERAGDIGGLGPGPWDQWPTPASPGVTFASTTGPGTGTTVTYTDSTVASHTAYWYRVSAENADGGSFPTNPTRILTLISTPTISLTQPAGAVFIGGAANTITASTAVSGSTIASSEYQLVANNAPGTFDAKDIFASQVVPTVPGARQPAPVPTNDPTDFSAMMVPVGAIAEYEILGRVSAVPTGTGGWQIGTPAILVYESVPTPPTLVTDTKFVGSRRPVMGDAVKVIAYRTIAAGPLIAKEIRYMAPAPQPVAVPAVTRNFLINGALTAMTPPVTAPGYLVSGEVWTVGVGKFRIDAPHFPAYVDANVGMGMNVTVRFAAAPAVANVARQIFNQVTTAIQTTIDVAPVFDNTPAPLNVPDGTWLYVIVDGVVSAKDLIKGTWTIGNEGIIVYESAGVLISPATVGDEVLMYCRRTLTPGPLVIEQVHNILPGPLIQPYKETALQIQLMYNGTIQTMGPNTWTVAGPAGAPVTFIVDDPEGDARIDPMPYASFSVGMPVTVEFEHVGEVLPDNANWANLPATFTLPAVPANQSGNLFLRTTDLTQQSSTSAYAASFVTASPLPPTLNSAVQTGTSAVTVTWTPATTGDPATSFRIERAVSTAPTVFTSVGTPAASAIDSDPLPGLQNSFVDSTVVVGTTYIYRVKGVNIISALGGAASNQSDPVLVSSVPVTPANLNVAVATNGTSVGLTWNASANATSYTVQRSPDGQPGTFATIGTPAVATFTDTIVASVIWHYRVFANSTVLGDNPTPSAVVMINTTTTAAPSDVTAAITASVTVSWTDTSSNETGFQVSRSTDNITFTPLNTVAANATSYVDATVVQLSTYYYQVMALGGAAPDSASSPSSAALLYDVPATPATFTATAVYPQISLTWSASANATGYIIDRDTVNTFNSANLMHFTRPATPLSYSDTAVVSGTVYYYQISATNVLGPSAVFTPTRSVMAALAPTGGGGGGGGGASLISVSLTDLSGSLSLNTSGVSQSAATLQNATGSVTIVVPSGTSVLNASGSALTTLSLSAVASPPAPPAGYGRVLVHNLGPNGAKFSPAITLTLAYSESSLPAGASEANLKIAWWNGTAWEMLASTVNATANTISAPISHLTEFAVLAQLPTTPTPTPTPTATPTPTPTATPTPTPTATPSPTPTAKPTTPPATTTPPVTAPAAFNWVLYGGIAAAVVVVILVIVLLMRRRG